MNKLKILSCAGVIALTGFVGIAWAIGVNDFHSTPFFSALSARENCRVGRDQFSEAADLRHSARSSIGAPTLVAQYRQERRALRKTIHTASLNEQAIRAQIGADLDVKWAHASERVRTELTQEQVEKLKQLAEKVDANGNARLARINERIAGP